MSNNVYELPPRYDDSIEEASGWLAMLDRGLTDEEQTLLQEWLAADPENPKVLMEVAGIWDKTNSLSYLAKLFPRTPNRQSKPPQPVLVVTVSVLLALLVVYGANIISKSTYFVEMRPLLTSAVNEQVFQTASGEQSTLNLLDGSRLMLNAGSLVRVTFTNQQRLLFLERGEMYIEVAHDKSRPLIVYAGNKSVEAVGTAFNLKFIRDQRVELIVTDGKVVVDTGRKDTASGEKTILTVPVVRYAPVTVATGQQILLGDADEEVKRIELEEIQSRLSWRELNFVFHGESLADALARIERSTFVKFIIVDENLKKLRIVGLFKANDIDGLLTTLSENFGISSERVSAEKIILTSR